jgi:hypothetical protein
MNAQISPELAVLATERGLQPAPTSANPVIFRRERPPSCHRRHKFRETCPSLFPSVMVMVLIQV